MFLVSCGFTKKDWALRKHHNAFLWNHVTYAANAVLIIWPSYSVMETPGHGLLRQTVPCWPKWNCCVRLHLTLLKYTSQQSPVTVSQCNKARKASSVLLVLITESHLCLSAIIWGCRWLDAWTLVCYCFNSCYWVPEVVLFHSGGNLAPHTNFIWQWSAFSTNSEVKFLLSPV